MFVRNYKAKCESKFQQTEKANLNKIPCLTRNL